MGPTYINIEERELKSIMREYNDKIIPKVV